MLARHRKPFICRIDSYEVTINDSDTVVMMEDAALRQIGNVLYKRGRDDDENRKAKKTKKSGNAAVDTRYGANAIIALHDASRRDNKQDKEASEKRKKDLKQEKDKTSKILTAVTGYKTRCTSRNAEYWTLHQSTASKDDMCLFLRLFAPDSGALSKKKDEVWKVLCNKVLPVTQAKFDSKLEDIQQRHDDAIRELQDSFPQPANATAIEQEPAQLNGEQRIDSTRESVGQLLTSLVDQVAGAVDNNTLSTSTQIFTL